MTLSEKREKVRELMAEGKVTISAMEAAPLIGVNQKTLIAGAKAGKYDPMRQAFFSGRNLRVCTTWIARMMGCE